MFRRASPMAHKGSPRYNLIVNKAAQSKKKISYTPLGKKGLMDKRAPTTTRNKEEKETKKPKKQSSNDIAESMERYINMKEKHFEIESSQLANEKKTAQAGDYSMRRCFSEIIKMTLSTDEKYS
jgi:hypothetical protein